MTETWSTNELSTAEELEEEEAYGRYMGFEAEPDLAQMRAEADAEIARLQADPNVSADDPEFEEALRRRWRTDGEVSQLERRQAEEQRQQQAQERATAGPRGDLAAWKRQLDALDADIEALRAAKTPLVELEWHFGERAMILGQIANLEQRIPYMHLKDEAVARKVEDLEISIESAKAAIEQITGPKRKARAGRELMGLYGQLEGLTREASARRYDASALAFVEETVARKTAERHEAESSTLQRQLDQASATFTAKSRLLGQGGLNPDVAKQVGAEAEEAGRLTREIQRKMTDPNRRKHIEAEVRAEYREKERAGVRNRAHESLGVEG